MATTEKRKYQRKPIPPDMKRRHESETEALKRKQATERKDLIAKHRKERNAFFRTEKAKKALPQLQAALDRKRSEAAVIAAQIAAATGAPPDVAAASTPAPAGTGYVWCSRCGADVPLTAAEAAIQASKNRVLREHRHDGCAPRRLPAG